MKLDEIIFIILMLIPMVFMGIFGQWRLFFVFFSFFICFGLQEWLSVVQTGHSISQLFWDFNTAHPVKANILICLMMSMWISLMMHFKKKSKDK